MKRLLAREPRRAPSPSARPPRPALGGNSHSSAAALLAPEALKNASRSRDLVAVRGRIDRERARRFATNRPCFGQLSRDAPRSRPGGRSASSSAARRELDDARTSESPRTRRSSGRAGDREDDRIVPARVRPPVERERRPPRTSRGTARARRCRRSAAGGSVARWAASQPAGTGRALRRDSGPRCRGPGRSAVQALERRARARRPSRHAQGDAPGTRARRPRRRPAGARAGAGAEPTARSPRASTRCHTTARRRSSRRARPTSSQPGERRVAAPATGSAADPPSSGASDRRASRRRASPRRACRPAGRTPAPGPAEKSAAKRSSESLPRATSRS